MYIYITDPKLTPGGFYKIISSIFLLFNPNYEGTGRASQNTFFWKSTLCHKC